MTALVYAFWLPRGEGPGMPGPQVSHKRPFPVHCRAAYMRPLHLSNILPCSNGKRPRNGQDRSSKHP